MKRDPTEEERKNIASLIAAGNKIEAIGMYISIAECGLTEAQDYIRNHAMETNVKTSEYLARKQQKRRGLFKRFIGAFRN